MTAVLAADGGGAVRAAPDMDSLGKQMAALRDAAKAGQFSVNDEGGKALLGAIHEMKVWVDQELLDQHFSGLNGAYGTSHGAGVVEPYMNKVATDADGYVPMMTKFRDVLQEAKSAIHSAMGNYRETEQSNADGSRAVQNDMPTLRSATKPT